MHTSLMRLAVIGLSGVSLAAVGNAAEAQTRAADRAADWRGVYVGLDVGMAGGQERDLQYLVDPGEAPDFIYNYPPQVSVAVPTGNDNVIRRDAAIPKDVTFSGRFTGFTSFKGFVIGLEAQASALALRRNLGASFRAGGYRANPATFYAETAISDETLQGQIDMDWSASLRARVGVPVSDRLLLSVFAGPSWLTGEASLRQDSAFSVTAYEPRLVGCPQPPFNGRPCVREIITTSEGTSEASRDYSVAGAVVGLAWDWRLSSRWIAHGEATLAQYESIEARSGGTMGADSRATYEPQIYGFAVGLAYKF